MLIRFARRKDISANMGVPQIIPWEGVPRIPDNPFASLVSLRMPVLSVLTSLGGRQDTYGVG